VDRSVDCHAREEEPVSIFGHGSVQRADRKLPFRTLLRLFWKRLDVGERPADGLDDQAGFGLDCEFEVI